jgi:hypothetical protein
MSEGALAPLGPVFQHTTGTRQPYVIESYCYTCGVFVAASASMKLIMIAEALHTCFDSSDLT